MTTVYSILYFLYLLLIGFAIAFLVANIPFKIKLLKGIDKLEYFEDTDDNAIMILNTDLANSYIDKLNDNALYYTKLVKLQIYKIVMSVVFIRSLLYFLVCLYLIYPSEYFIGVAALLFLAISISAIIIAVSSIVILYNLITTRISNDKKLKEAKEDFRELLYRSTLNMYDKEHYDYLIEFNKNYIKEATKFTYKESWIVVIVSCVFALILLLLTVLVVSVL